MSHMMVITPLMLVPMITLLDILNFYFFYLNLIYIKLESTNITLDSTTITYDDNYIIFDDNNWVGTKLTKKSEYCRMILIFLLNFFSIYIYIYNLLSNLRIATATVERSFLAMKIVNNRLRSRMSNQWIDDNLIVYIGKDNSHSINKIIM